MGHDRHCQWFRWCRRRLQEVALWGMTDTVNDSDGVEGGCMNMLYGAQQTLLMIQMV